MDSFAYASIPLSWIGPLKISGNVVNEEIKVPLATYESPLWPSVGRGAKISRLTSDGIVAILVDDRMTRSVVVEAPDAMGAYQACCWIDQHFVDLVAVVQQCSRYACLIAVHHEIVANLVFIRLEFTTGDASGHNMATLAADRILDYLLREIPNLSYSSISGNYCTDKKATAINGILGRGKRVITEILIPQQIVEERLHTTAEKIARLNIHKNLVGTLLAGGIRSANAHYANMLLGFYLATGQDAANIVEGSQGITLAENRNGDLYFSCTIPNIIVGTVGNGKDLDFVRSNLARLGCNQDSQPGDNAKRLAICAAATVLCGELSLLAAQTNPGELMNTHITLERHDA